MRKWIPLDFGPKPIFSSKDAAKGRNILDSFFVGKISYYMVTPTTSFCDAESKWEKLVGGGELGEIAGESVPIFFVKGRS